MPYIGDDHYLTLTCGVAIEASMTSSLDEGGGVSMGVATPSSCRVEPPVSTVCCEEREERGVASGVGKVSSHEEDDDVILSESGGV